MHTVSHFVCFSRKTVVFCQKLGVFNLISVHLKKIFTLNVSEYKTLMIFFSTRVSLKFEGYLFKMESVYIYEHYENVNVQD